MNYYLYQQLTADEPDWSQQVSGSCEVWGIAVNPEIPAKATSSASFSTEKNRKSFANRAVPCTLA